MLRLLKYLKPFTAMIIAVLAFVFLQTLSDLYLPTLMADIINKGVMQGDTGKILQIGGLMLWVAGGEWFVPLLPATYRQKLRWDWGLSCVTGFFLESKAIHYMKLISLVQPHLSQELQTI